MTFAETLTAAINDLVENGFDSMARVQHWTEAIRRAAEAETSDPHVLEEQLQRSLAGIYRRMVDQGGLVKMHPGVARFTLERVRPALRAELDRRIMASANLIVLNRKSSIEKTLQRFAGWSTSIPAGGTDAANKAKVKREQKKALGALPFEERRVLIDQGHKLTAALSETLARGGGAIAARWHSHWRQAGYDYREDHRERDNQIYTVRGCWALERGLMKVGPEGYTDGITTPSEEVFCRCYYTWLYNLRDLPADMVTARGRDELARVRAAIRAA